MTVVPHDGISTRRLRESAGAIRSRVGSRLARPSGRRAQGPSAQSSADESLETAQSSGAAALPTGAFGINLGAISPTVGVNSLRLVLSGRRVRLSNGAFVMLVLGLLTTILVALLLLNTALAENSFQLNGIRQSARELTVREQVLSGQLAAAESPIGLEKRAKELGMVAGGSPVFLRLSDGKVLGQSSPAEAPPAPAKPKKPKVLPDQGQFAGEFPVSPGTLAGENPMGATSGTFGGESPVTTVPGVATQLQGEVPIPAGGEQPLGVVRGTTR